MKDCRDEARPLEVLRQRVGKKAAEKGMRIREWIVIV